MESARYVREPQLSELKGGKEAEVEGAYLRRKHHFSSTSKINNPMGKKGMALWGD